MTEEQPKAFSIPRLDDADVRLIDHYVRVGQPVDLLAYTGDFDKLYEALSGLGDRRSKAEIFRRLLYLRKSGRLPRLGRQISSSSSSDDDG